MDMDNKIEEMEFSLDDIMNEFLEKPEEPDFDVPELVP